MTDEIPDSTPDTPLQAFLSQLADAVGVDTVDQLWIFPTQTAGTLESTVIVISAFEPDGDRRRVITAHRTSRRDAKRQISHQDAIIEHGSAPADRIGRMVDGVLRRIGDDLAAAPRAYEIGGAGAAWSEMWAGVAG